MTKASTDSLVILAVVRLCPHTATCQSRRKGSFVHLAVNNCLPPAGPHPESVLQLVFENRARVNFGREWHLESMLVVVSRPCPLLWEPNQCWAGPTNHLTVANALVYGLAFSKLSSSCDVVGSWLLPKPLHLLELTLGMCFDVPLVFCLFPSDHDCPIAWASISQSNVWSIVVVRF